MEDPKTLLEKEYLRRRERNPQYSLRAFSRLLNLPSGRVSQLLSEKRSFTPKLGEQIAQQLQLDPRQSHALQESIRRIRSKKAPPPAPCPPKELDMDAFASIAEPLHYALLSLWETDQFAGTVSAAAQSLGCSVVETRRALSRLARLGLLEAKEPGRFALPANAGVSSPHDIPSAAIRRAHRKVLSEAQEALEEVATEFRDFTSMTMAIDPAKLPEAKKRIREFRRSLTAFLENGAKKEVYRLNVQLMPLTEGMKK